MSIASITEENIQNNMVDLTKYIPDYIYNCPHTQQVFLAQERQLAILNYYISDMIENCFIETATWGLDIWEKEYCIITDTSLSYEARRQTLLARKLGFGTVNEAKIKSIANAYNCDCEVMPHWDEYYFIIKFIGLGIPNNLDTFKSIIEQIKPAHLGVKYEFTYETWNEVKNFTCWDLKHDTWDQVLKEPLKHYTMNNTNSVVGEAIVGQSIIGEVNYKDLTNSITGSALVGYSKLGNNGTN